MSTYTTTSNISLEEQRIAAALAKIKEWQQSCSCQAVCENYGCDSLEELARILKGEVKP